ncbi:MAG TPA: hypothetical protein VEY51_11850 [Chondromyces sp.]|nr:hypothetical protein [Chondromyces sp.]
MESTTTTPAKLIVQQGKNVLTSMKDLKLRAKKKGRERFDLYERFCANCHSFEVYTYMDPKIGQSAEVQAFQQKLESFRAEFADVRTDFDKEVDMKQVKVIYEEVLAAYNAMVNILGFDEEAVNIKRL